MTLYVAVLISVMALCYADKLTINFQQLRLAHGAVFIWDY